MKLNDVIRHLSIFNWVKLYLDDDEDPVFEGNVLDVPWCYLDMKLDTCDEYEAIGISSFTNNCGVLIYVFDINLKE